MQFKLVLPYTNTDEQKKEISDAGLTVDYINWAITSKHNNQLDGQSRRIFARMQNKMDEAVLGNKDSVEFENAEMDFLKAAFNWNELKFPVHSSRYVVVLEDYIASLSAQPKGAQ